MPSKRTIKLGGSKYSHLKKSKKLNKRQQVQVKRIVGRNIETKYYDSAYPGNTGYTGVDSAGTITDLTQVPNASPPTDSSRVGDVIKFKKMLFKANVYLSSTATWNFIRVILFQWKPATTPTPGSILHQISDPRVITTPYVNDTRSQYRILYDKVIHLDYNNGPASKIVSKTLYGKKIAKKIQYNSTVLTPGYNHIYSLIVSDDAATPYPQYDIQARLWYTDA